MKKDYDFSKWDWMYDNDFMTYQELIERLRKDLNEPNFFAYDLFVPHDEEEYKEVLADTKRMQEIIRNPHSNNVISPKTAELEYGKPFDQITQEERNAFISKKLKQSGVFNKND
ncbi:hypothetical protein [Pediococcus pentosaceus]|uniref:hypothetical protein n=1 Tax=Pediococcus pentosaceus TaxID=1255 RepID=UPI001F588799|nr:hypothetical protein [Pediococcus pentosaceus]MCI2961056.1 hypothetical protein [Pediococcus pentosaceus]